MYTERRTCTVFSFYVVVVVIIIIIIVIIIIGETAIF
jgi:hypothetical protein